MIELHLNIIVELLNIFRLVVFKVRVTIFIYLIVQESVLSLRSQVYICH